MCFALAGLVASWCPPLLTNWRSVGARCGAGRGSGCGARCGFRHRLSEHRAEQVPDVVGYLRLCFGGLRVGGLRVGGLRLGGLCLGGLCVSGLCLGGLCVDGGRFRDGLGGVLLSLSVPRLGRPGYV